ncbi:unnamed protein product [Rotaria sp. Silwood1]|nr:unnamed protein product [Rotaria sp. Silwood1]CAF1598940.1 unnamed protein product [Rotaria sp. Silwood1]CAF1601487.1 unnamed protein product [Rotaria sp. Silwood1]CAF3688110.1 unnamed protein product [Rotaria sp. Silwood1]CAF3787368.1 unnamed protein product [Rotaria sp. Silwood1]
MSRFQLIENSSQPVQSIDIINPSREILTQNQEGNTLVWYDTSLRLTNQDIINTKQALRSVNDYVLLFDDEEKCVHYINSIHTDNSFMVIFGASSTTFLPRIHELKQVKIICIFCMNGEAYKSLLNDYSKVIGICIEQEQLVTCLKKAIRSFLQNPSLISLMKNNTKQETHLDAVYAHDFKKQQLIKNIILRMPQTPQSKQNFIDYCRFYYQGNQKVLSDIDYFNEHYESPCHAIYFYTRDSFVYRLMNHTFRIQDPQLLERFHFYIVDLSQSLKDGFEKLKTSSSSSEQKTLTLYRGHKFTKEEYSRFRLCEYVTFNSYLSTSSNIEVAKLYYETADNQISSETDLVTALFLIEVDLMSLNNNTVIFANIAEESNFPEEYEYLFDFGATFEIISINDNNRTIKMIISDKPHHVSSIQLNNAYLYKYASQETIDQIDHDPPPANFAEYLVKIDKSLKRLDAFEDFILKTSINDENYQTASKCCIEGCDLPRIDPNSLYARECRKLNPDNPYTDEYTNAYKQAIKYFHAFHNYTSDDSIQWSLRALGFTYYKIDNYEQAQKYFLEALKVNHDPINLATCHHFLGCIYGKLSNYVESMNYFNKVLEMKDIIKLPFIAATYCQMAIFESQNKEKEYLSQQMTKKEYLSNALNIYQQTNEELSILYCRSELLGLEHEATRDNSINILDHYFKYCQDNQIVSKLIAELYASIGRECFEYLDYDQALDCCMKSLLHVSNNESCHKIIAHIHIRKKNSELAIEYLEKTLKLINDSRKKVTWFLLIGMEYFKRNNFNMALSYLEASASECEKLGSDTQFYINMFKFELQRKSQIQTCRLFIKPHCQKTKALYWYTRALNFSLDFIQLFRSDIIFFFQSIDFILKSNYTEQVKYLIEENINNNESHLKKFILGTIFDNYITMGDSHDENNLFYYAKALEIYDYRKSIGIDRNIEVMCTLKINHILKSNYSYDELINYIREFLRITDLQMEMQEEEHLFFKNYSIELQKNHLAKIHSYIADVYSKEKTYEKAILYYDKSIKYYETFASLFHLELADLYSKKGAIIHTQHNLQKVTDSNIISQTTAHTLFEKAFATIKYEGHCNGY